MCTVTRSAPWAARAGREAATGAQVITYKICRVPSQDVPSSLTRTLPSQEISLGRTGPTNRRLSQVQAEVRALRSPRPVHGVRAARQTSDPGCIPAGGWAPGAEAPRGACPRCRLGCVPLRSAARASARHATVPRSVSLEGQGPVDACPECMLGGAPDARTSPASCMVAGPRVSASAAGRRSPP